MSDFSDSETEASDLVRSEEADSLVAAEFPVVPPSVGGITGHTAPTSPSPRLAATRRLVLTGAEKFWYILQCISFGAGYFAKVQMQKALSDAGLIRMTDAGQFWYVVQCISFGAGYFAKIPHKKALSELVALPVSPGTF